MTGELLKEQSFIRKRRLLPAKMDLTNTLLKMKAATADAVARMIKINGKQLVCDTETVNQNKEHLIEMCEFTTGDFCYANIPVNPYTGLLLDRGYEIKDSDRILFSRSDGILFMNEKHCALTDRARQNLSNTFYAFTEDYLPDIKEKLNL